MWVGTLPTVNRKLGEDDSVQSRINALLSELVVVTTKKGKQTTSLEVRQVRSSAGSTSTNDEWVFQRKLDPPVEYSG